MKPHIQIHSSYRVHLSPRGVGTCFLHPSRLRTLAHSSPELRGTRDRVHLGTRETWVQILWPHLRVCLPLGLTCSKGGFDAPLAVGLRIDQSVTCTLGRHLIANSQNIPGAPGPREQVPRMVGKAGPPARVEDAPGAAGADQKRGRPLSLAPTQERGLLF